LQQDYQFVIGSISKQFTAVMVLQAYEKGLIKLNSTIKKYLPELTQSWADSITVHQLLTHTHGIQQLDKPLVFKAGTQFEYSQIGYNILASILERVNSKSFSDLSAELFEKCAMQNTFHPDIKKYLNLVKGYTEQDNGTLAFENESFNNYAAAGSFISTAQDLDLWNQNLQGGKLLKKGTFKMMVTKQKFAIRKHPIFGLTQYGYGLTVDKKEDILQIGQTGFAPGFISMNFYFPKTQTSAIVLENVAYDTNDLKKTFHYHTEILKIVRKEIRKAKNAPY
jgi:D-alanyl-D-alanine carboxypeptidase